MSRPTIAFRKRSYQLVGTHYLRYKLIRSFDKYVRSTMGRTMLATPHTLVSIYTSNTLQSVIYPFCFIQVKQGCIVVRQFQFHCHVQEVQSRPVCKDNGFKPDVHFFYEIAICSLFCLTRGEIDGVIKTRRSELYHLIVKKQQQQKLIVKGVGLLSYTLNERSLARTRPQLEEESLPRKQHCVESFSHIIIYISKSQSTLVVILHQ